jgi:hypothetical protein
MLYPFLTADAVRQAVERIRNACADSGRDPKTQLQPEARSTTTSA